MEVTFKNQSSAHNPFQTNSEAIYSSSSSHQQRPYSSAHQNSNSKEAEYSSELNASFDGNDRYQRDQESKVQDNHEEDQDDMNISFANQDEDAVLEKSKPHEREEDLLRELESIKEDISQTKEQQRTGNVYSTPKKQDMNQDLSPTTYVRNFRDTSPNRVVTEEEFKDYYDKFCVAFLQRKEEELLKKRKEKADQELAELQDKPTLISKPNSRKYIPLMDRTPILDAKRARELEKIRRERDEKLQKELEELTFKPKINERSKSICSPKKEQPTRSKSQIREVSPVGGSRIAGELFKPKINRNSEHIARGIIDDTSDDVVDRLYFHADQGNNKKQELTKQLTPNFTPALNKKSQKIAKQIEDQRNDISQYQSEGGNSVYRSNSRNRQSNTNPEIRTVEGGNDTDLLEILKQFNQMLKQKNESPINLEQLSALMTDYADKRKYQNNERFTTEENDEEDENTEGEESEDEDEDEEDLDSVPYFPNDPSRRCETEPAQKSNKQLNGGKKASKNSEDEDQDFSKMHRELQQLQDKLRDNSSPKKQAVNKKKVTMQTEESEEHESKKDSQSPRKNGSLMSNLIKNPRTLNKNDDPPVTPISESLRQRALELSAKKTSPNKDSNKLSSPKKGEINRKSLQSAISATPKNTKGINSNSKSASQKTLGSTSQKGTSTIDPKTGKPKKKKGTKKGKKVKTENLEGTEKSSKKSKKSQGNSEQSSLVAATAGSKNGLEGWKLPPQEVQDAADEEAVLVNQGRESTQRSIDENNGNNCEEAKHGDHPGEQTFGTDRNNTTDNHNKERSNKSRGSQSNATEKSFNAQNNNTEAINEFSQNSTKNKIEGSRKGSEINGSFNSQDQFNEIEREIVMDREQPLTEKVKSLAVPRSRYGSEYSRSQLSKAVLEEGEENEADSNKEKENGTEKSQGQTSSKNNVQSQKSSRNQVDEEGSQRDGTTNQNQRGSKSLFSALNNKDEKWSTLSNNNDESYNIYGSKHQDSFDGAEPQSQNTIREGAHANGENSVSSSTNKNAKKSSVDDQNASLSSNKNGTKGERNVNAPAGYSSNQATSEHVGSATMKSYESEQSRGRSRKNMPAKCEVMNTETIQIQPPSQVRQLYKYAMDGRDKNLTSASSRGLKAIAEHAVQKFKTYDAQIKQTKQEYRVSVSRSESRSVSPEAQEPAPRKKESIVQQFKTPEKKEVKAINEELKARDLSAQKKTRASVFTPMTPEKIEVASGKKTANVKRHSVAVPMSHVIGKKEN